MRQSCIDFDLTPSMLLKEFVDFQLTDGLQAYPLCPNVTRVCVLDGKRIHDASIYNIKKNIAQVFILERYFFVSIYPAAIPGTYLAVFLVAVLQLC